ncbi:hypothetical protein D3C75_706380 [compost metagenome]
MFGTANVSRFVAKLAVNLRKRSSAQRVVARAQINQQQGVIFGFQLWRYGAAYIFNTGKCGDHQRQRRGHLALLVAFLPAGFHRHRVFAHWNCQAQRWAKFFAHGFHRFVQAGVLTRMTGCGHPVCREFNTVECTDLRSRNVGQRFTDRQAT